MLSSVNSDLFIQNRETPFYYYDIELLRETIHTVLIAAGDSKLHYAVKANNNPLILNEIVQSGMGADCVSGNEVRRAIEAGVNPEKIVFAGVGKSDPEIIYALEQGIGSINCESLEEIQVVNQLASLKGLKPNISIRINPGVDAKTHAKISTGLRQNKFGIWIDEAKENLFWMQNLEHVNLNGIHFHIGSQITDMSVFKEFFNQVNKILKEFKELGFNPKHINLGGGLGIDYHNPESNRIPDFKTWFDMADLYIDKEEYQVLHFEPGRSIVGQSGFLMTKVLYTKSRGDGRFVIVDAGMTELIRPALYGSYHKAVNISSSGKEEMVEIVGPVCESSDTFGSEIAINQPKRGDLIAFCSAGAYGESMSLGYNLRKNVSSVLSSSVG